MYDNMRRLHPRGAANRGICVDADGAMLGPDCVLVHRTPNGFRAIEREAASTVQKCLVGARDDPNWPFQRCRHIAELLDNGELALAQIYGLHIPVGDLDDLQLKQLARAHVAKAGFNPDEPRIPKGDHGGGEWTTGDGGGSDDAGSDDGSTRGPPPMEFRIVSPDTDTAPREAAPESNSSNETTAGVTPTSGTDTATTVGEREVVSHHSPGNSGGGADYHGDAIYPDYTFENVLFFFVGGTARKLTGALIKAGFKRGVDEDTHHIVARGAERADPARKILERLGIDLDDAFNGAFLPRSQHQHLHENAYYDAVNRELSKATTKSEVQEILRSIARALEAGNFP